MPTFFTEAQKSLVTAMLDRLIPRQDSHPGAGEIGRRRLSRRRRIRIEPAPAYLLGRPKHRPSRGRTERLWLRGSRTPIQQDEVLREIEANHSDFFQRLVMLTYNGYYINPTVLESLGLEARPPQPRGYVVEAGDLSSLEAVVRARPGLPGRLRRGQSVGILSLISLSRRSRLRLPQRHRDVAPRPLYHPAHNVRRPPQAARDCVRIVHSHQYRVHLVHNLEQVLAASSVVGPESVQHQAAHLADRLRQPVNIDRWAYVQLLHRRKRRPLRERERRVGFDELLQRVLDVPAEIDLRMLSLARLQRRAQLPALAMSWRDSSERPLSLRVGLGKRLIYRFSLASNRGDQVLGRGRR